MPATVPQGAAPAAQIAVISADWSAADTRPPPKPAAARTAAVRPLPLTDQRIKDAVAEIVAVAPDKPAGTLSGQAAPAGIVLSADKIRFAREIDKASVPGCMGADGLKFQPPQLGPVVFSGVLTLPFLLVAAARGKCK